MGGDGVGAFAVGSGGGVVIDMIAELIAQRNRIGVIVILRLCLVGHAGIEGDAFVDIGVPVPDTLADVLKFP